jgi:hypothetical protein
MDAVWHITLRLSGQKKVVAVNHFFRFLALLFYLVPTIAFMLAIRFVYGLPIPPEEKKEALFWLWTVTCVFAAATIGVTYVFIKFLRKPKTPPQAPHEPE